jgi:hypothetical protein
MLLEGALIGASLSVGVIGIAVGGALLFSRLLSRR